MELPSSSASAAHRAKVILRTALAVVWIHEGLVPKLLFPMARELDLVASTGLYWPTPRATLGALGVVEMICGLWLLTGRGERVAALISTVVLIGLTPLMVSLNPAVLYHPYGGVSKNLGLIACGVAIWMLSRGESVARRSNHEERSTDKFTTESSRLAPSTSAVPLTAAVSSQRAGKRLPTRRLPPAAVTDERVQSAQYGMNEAVKVEPSVEARPLSPTQRAALATLAFAGTALHAGSFLAADGPRALSPIGIRVGICAALSWPVLGVLLLVLARRLPIDRRPAILEWADLCLRAMAFGMIGLAGAAGFNLACRYWTFPAGWIFGVHIGCIAGSNLTMASIFTRGAKRLGLSPTAVWAAWLLGLNGTFGVLFLLLSR